MRFARAGKRTVTAAVALFGVWLVLAPGPAIAAQLDPSLCAPDTNSFTTDITNPYFPLGVGQQWVLSGIDEGQTIGLQITVLKDTQRLYSGRQRVTTRVVEELEWVDTNANGVVDRGEPLIEVSRNYFAQTQDGTVCYFGEAVDIYENGIVVSDEGSWRADEQGNAPGIFMPAQPQSGMSFAQEDAPGVAEDQATIVGSGTVTVPFGTFTDTIRVHEVNPLDGDKGYKIYALGVGLIQDGPLSLIRH
jgi:hypothetical protein